MSGAYPEPPDDTIAPAVVVVDPRRKALEAAEARTLLAESTNSTAEDAFSRSAYEDFNPSAVDKLPFHRLLDRDMLPGCSIPQRVKTLEMLLTLTRNVLDPPTPSSASKFRTLRLNNPGIQRNIVGVPGAFDYLVACGFRKTIDDFVPYLNFSPSPSPKILHSLRVGHHVLTIVIETAKAAELRVQKFRSDEKDEGEATRVRRTMLAFEEDRRLKREKDDRAKIVRDARAGQRTHVSVASTEPYVPPPQHDRDEASVDLDDSDDYLNREASRGDAGEALDNDMDSSMTGEYPSQMMGSSRVLGTGAAVIPPPERHGAGPGGSGRRGSGRGGRKRDYDADDDEAEGDL